MRSAIAREHKELHITFEDDDWINPIPKMICEYCYSIVNKIRFKIVIDHKAVVKKNKIAEKFATIIQGTPKSFDDMKIWFSIKEPSAKRLFNYTAFAEALLVNRPKLVFGGVYLEGTGMMTTGIGVNF